MYSLPAPLVLRNAAESDAPFCQALYASTRDDLRQLPLPAPAIDQLIAMQQRVHEQGQRAGFPGARTLILEHGGQPVGRVVLDAGGRAWRLVDLALAPAAQGRGMAAAVLRALQADAAACGASIGLAVAKTNQRALRLYLRAGFLAVSGNELQDEMVWRAQ